MSRLFRRPKERVVRFCQRCSRLCDDACRRSALRERVLLQQLWLGMRI